MCMSCGCKMPNEMHGDERHITFDDLRQAAEANGSSVDEVVNNIYQTFQEVGGEESFAGTGRETAGT